MQSNQRFAEDENGSEYETYPAGNESQNSVDEPTDYQTYSSSRQDGPGEEDFDDEDGQRSRFGQVVYFGVLALIVLVLIGLPMWVLVNQEDPQEVAGVSEMASNEAGSDDFANDFGSNQVEEEESVYIYDPETQTFIEKDETNGDSSAGSGETFYNDGGDSGAVNLNPGQPIAGVTFAEAFTQARNQLGPGATFEWNGQLYNTDFRSDEPEGVQDTYPKNIFSSLESTKKFVNDSDGKVLEINECNLNIKYPTKTANGALVDFDRIDFVDDVKPYWNFYAFTGYNDQGKYGTGYTFYVQCFNLSELGEAYNPNEENSVAPQELLEKTGWLIAEDSIENLQMSRNKDLIHGYSVSFTRGGQLYSMNFMTKPKDASDTIGGLYSHQVQMQFQDTVR